MVLVSWLHAFRQIKVLAPGIGVWHQGQCYPWDRYLVCASLPLKVFLLSPPVLNHAHMNVCIKPGPWTMLLIFRWVVSLYDGSVCCHNCSLVLVWLDPIQSPKLGFNRTPSHFFSVFLALLTGVVFTFMMLSYFWHVIVGSRSQFLPVIFFLPFFSCKALSWVFLLPYLPTRTACILLLFTAWF